MKQIRLFMYYLISVLAYQALNVADFFMGIVMAFIESWDSAKQMEREANSDASKWQQFFDN